MKPHKFIVGILLAGAAGYFCEPMVRDSLLAPEDVTTVTIVMASRGKPAGQNPAATEQPAAITEESSTGKTPAAPDPEPKLADIPEPVVTDLRVDINKITPPPPAANPDTNLAAVEASNAEQERLARKQAREEEARRTLLTVKLDPKVPREAEILRVFERKDFKIDDDIRSAYLNWAKDRTTAAVRKLYKKASNMRDGEDGYQYDNIEDPLPADFLEWIDSDPVVAASIYGIAENSVQRLVMLRSLDIDLGDDLVRKRYTQLCLALVDKYAAVIDPVTVSNPDYGIGLHLRPRFTLEIRREPLQMVDTRDQNRTLDINDHIINFLEEHPVPLGRKSPIYGDLDVKIAKGMGYDTTDGRKAPDFFEKRNRKPVDRLAALDEDASGEDKAKRGSSSVSRISNQRNGGLTRPLYAYELMTTPKLQAEFNDYMKAHGHDVNIRTGGEEINGHSPFEKEINKASQLFLTAYQEKGRIPKTNDPLPTPLEMAAFLIRSNEDRLPDKRGSDGSLGFDINNPWPVLDMLVSDRLPLRERQYIWELRRDHGIAIGYGQYHSCGIAFKIPMLMARRMQPFDFPYNSYPMMLKDGGVCGVMANIGRRLAISLGIPAVQGSQPGHACFIQMNGNPKDGFRLSAEQSISTPEKTYMSGRGTYLDNVADLNAVNQGFTDWLDAEMCLQINRCLPEATPPAYRLSLLTKAAIRNPYHLRLTTACLHAATDASSAAETFTTLAKHINRGGKRIERPEHNLERLKPVIDEILEKLPTPDTILATRDISELIEKFGLSKAWLKYQIAVHGAFKVMAMVESELDSHLEGKMKQITKLDRSTLIAERVRALAGYLDATQRIEFARILQRRLWNRELLALDPIDPSRDEEMKAYVALGMDPAKHLIVEPVVPEVLALGMDQENATREAMRVLQQSINGHRTKEHCYAVNKLVALIASHTKEKAAFGSALYQIIRGKELYMPTQLKNDGACLDPVIKTILGLGVAPSDSISNVIWTFSAAARDGAATSQSVTARSEYLNVIASAIKNPADRAKLGNGILSALPGNLKFTDAPKEKMPDPDPDLAEKLILDPAVELAFELGTDVEKAAQNAVFEYREFVRKPRQKKESDAYALYLKLIVSHMKDESAKRDFGSKLLAEVSGNEVYKSAKSASGKSYAEGSLWVIYSLGVDMAPVWDELERAISRAGRTSNEKQNHGVASWIQAVGESTASTPERKAWAEKLLSLYGRNKPDSDSVAKAIYLHLRS